jgi:transposase
MPRTRYTKDYIETVVKYVSTGYSCKEASEKFNVSIPTVYNWIKKTSATLVATPVLKTKKTTKAKTKKAKTANGTSFIACRIPRGLKRSLKHWALDNGNTLQGAVTLALERMLH